ncbi:LANO_0B04962g1_1 [Lachancea nothofagi CBS 11611]|uniref:Chromatin modification-related protein n=1 Tax=Lachancea nothofagi CBS 11611 TaxID=1266666 RepID=A0A1G4IY19_9SACH|nr:LANO_0B04962g1_1 [Lachancea nothofagi CBS 11611]
MDPSSALEQTTLDVSNLQSEFKYILDEIGNADLKIYDSRKKCLQRDLQIQKFYKQHGSLTENPRESELSEKVLRDLQLCRDLQNDKCVLSNTALFLVTKHLTKLQDTIKILEEDNSLAPAENDEKEAESGGDNSRESSVFSGSGEARRKKNATPGPTAAATKRKRKSEGPPSARNKDSTPVGSADPNFDLQDYNDDLFSGYNQAEEDDKQLYCFCQSVSYGEMVACDGPHCKFEWFHYTCVNLKEPPKGSWYCPDCRQELANSRLKKRKM